MTKKTLLALGTTLALLAACDDETKDAGGDAISADGPLYLVSTAFFTADQVETYLITSPDFDSFTEIDPTSGVKLLGEIVPVVHDGAVFVTDESDPALVKRYKPNARGQLAKDAEISFAGVGVSGIASWFVYYVSETKAYVFDQAGSRIVVWDPSTMKLTGKEIDLSEYDRDGYQLRLALELFSARQSGSELVVPTSWVGQDREVRYATGVLVFDIESDEVKSFAEDTRCGEAYMSLESPDGDLYFFPSAASSAQHHYADEKGDTCVLRVRKGETGFDKDYQLDLAALGGGRAATSAMPDGGSGFFFSTSDDELFAQSEENGGAFWHVWHYDFETEKAQQVEGLPVWAGSLYYVDVGGELFLPYWVDDADGSRTTLYKLEPNRRPEELFSFAASWAGFAKLR